MREQFSGFRSLDDVSRSLGGLNLRQFSSFPSTMFGTRSQTQAQGFDENRRAEVKGMAVASKAPNLGQPKAMNTRRALGDIGNLVGSLSSSCNVKDEIVVCKPHGVPIDRPITRRYAQAHNLNVGVNLGKPPIPLVPAARHMEITCTTNDDVPWGAKQRRTKQTQDASVATAVVETREVAVQVQSGLLRPILPQPRSRPVVKKPTLTTQLAAWSQADSVMVDANEESLRDIDADDVGNHLAVVEYVEDIYSSYRKAELEHCIPHDFMSRQTEINDKMRTILVDWLIEVHYKFRLMPETLYLTVRIIDDFLSRQAVTRHFLQLVGVTSMLIASKYEEIWAPEMQDFVLISDNTYSKDEILGMEKKMLNTLNFNLTVPTPYVFVVRFLKAALSNREMESLVFFLVELCLTEYVMLRFPPSLLAASAVYTAQCCLMKSPLWTPLLQRHTGYSEMQLRDCAKLMASFHQQAESNHRVVHKKYSTSRYGCVAAIPPAQLPK